MRLTLLYPDDKYVRHLYEVTSTMTLDKHTIDEEGLFSTKIFGSLGTAERLQRFGYIKLHKEIIHPSIFNTLISYSSLHKDIIHGKVKATFKKGKFVFDDNGETGYTFFKKHIKDLVLEDSESKKKQNKIQNFRNSQKISTLTVSYLLVIPAGIRDVVIEDERVTEDELNEFYKKAMNATNMLKYQTTNIDPFLLNLQNKIGDLRNAIYLRLKGKKGYIGAHVSTLKVDYGTSNVISGNSEIIESLKDNTVDIANTSNIGIFQFMKASVPKVIHGVHKNFVNGWFDSTLQQAYLFDEDNNYVATNIRTKFLKQWSTVDGINELIDKMKDYYFRDYPITYTNDKGKLLHLVMVEDKDDTLTLYRSKIPKDVKVRPLTYGEMFSIAMTPYKDESSGTMTRYPIADQASTNIVKFKVTTTMKERVVNIKIINTNNETELKVFGFPVKGEKWNEALVPSYVTLKGLSADMDG